MSFSIEDFWTKRFSSVIRTSSAKPYPGWDAQCEREESYVQAQLTLRQDFADLSQPVWLVGAPGAVGKSTLAKEICAATGAVYLDLASAATVAGNYMVGGLVYTGLLTAWTEGRTAVLVDALDEARLRVTQSGFEAFLSDVAKVARMGAHPIVLLGRVGIIEETWTILNEHEGLEPPIFDIELFSPEQAERFVLARLGKLAKNASHNGKPDYPGLAGALAQHTGAYESAVHNIVMGLQALSGQDGNRFFGYAPVLDAVSKVVANENNPARINEEMRRVLEGDVIISLSNEILHREETKLVAQVDSASPGLPLGLYEPPEQLERLASRIFKLPQAAMPSQLQPQQIAAYEEAVSNLLPQHPFLDGAGTSPSSAIFAASIVSAALKGRRPDQLAIAETYANSGQHTPNPFLFEFYRAGGVDKVATEHIGLLFESVLAKSKPGDTVRLTVEESDDDMLAVEIMIFRQDGQAFEIEFAAPNQGTIRFGRRVAGISISSEHVDVDLGMGDQLELVGPVSIMARTVRLACTQIVIKADQGVIDGDVVSIEAAILAAEPTLGAPAVRGDARLQVAWPGVSTYPWTKFAAAATEDEDPVTADALRALRRLAMAFRSHSKGRLARFKGKIDHVRMLKGSVGTALLAKLMRDKVISLEGTMYFLDPGALGATVGASFLDLQLKQYSSKAREYVQHLLA